MINYFIFLEETDEIDENLFEDIEKNLEKINNFYKQKDSSYFKLISSYYKPENQELNEGFRDFFDKTKDVLFSEQLSKSYFIRNEQSFVNFPDLATLKLKIEYLIPPENLSTEIEKIFNEPLFQHLFISIFQSNVLKEYYTKVENDKILKDDQKHIIFQDDFLAYLKKNIIFIPLIEYINGITDGANFFIFINSHNKRFKYPVKKGFEKLVKFFFNYSLFTHG